MKVLPTGCGVGPGVRFRRSPALHLAHLARIWHRESVVLRGFMRFVPDVPDVPDKSKHLWSGYQSQENWWNIWHIWHTHGFDRPIAVFLPIGRTCPAEKFGIFAAHMSRPVKKPIDNDQILSTRRGLSVTGIELEAIDRGKFRQLRRRNLSTTVKKDLEVRAVVRS